MSWRMLRRLAGAIVLLVIAVAVLLTAYLRRDQTHVFRQAHQRLSTTRVVETWRTTGSRVERLRFLDATGAELATAVVRLPAMPEAVRRTLVVYAGQNTGDQILDLIPERPDVALVAPLYPRLESRSWQQKLAWPGEVRRAVFTTVAGGKAAVDHLDATGVGRGRTSVLAASLGSSFGTIHAALDDRVDDLVVVHGGGEFPLILRHVYQGREQPLRAAVVPWLAEALIDTFDPVHWIDDVAPANVLIIASRRDRHFPVASAEALYHTAGEPKSILWTDTGHVGASKRDIVDAIVAEIEAYLDRTAPERPGAIDGDSVEDEIAIGQRP